MSARRRAITLFAWTGDLERKGNDFLAIIDADPASSSYGRLVTTLPTDQKTVRIHHTEYDGAPRKTLKRERPKIRPSVRTRARERS